MAQIGLVTWFANILIAVIGYIWAISVFHRWMVSRVTKRFSGSPQSFFKELPALLALCLVAEGPTEINALCQRQLKEGNLTHRQVMAALAFNSLPLAGLFLFFILAFQFPPFSVLLVLAFVLWVVEKSFRTTTSGAFILFGLGLCGIGIERAMQQSSSLLSGLAQYDFVFLFASRHWLVIAMFFVASFILNFWIRKWILFMTLGLILGVIGIASIPVTLLIFSGAWCGQLFADYRYFYRAPWRRLYGYRAAIGLVGLLAAILWSVFASPLRGAGLEGSHLYVLYMAGLAFVIGLELLVSSLFFHIYFARMARASLS